MEGLADLVAGGVAHLRQADDVRQAFDAWNALAGRLALPKARSLDDGRRRAIRARLADGGMEAWVQALAAVEASRHCRGENDRGWRADLDFVCQPKSWRRLLEGTYGPVPSKATQAVAQRPPWSGPADLRAAIAAYMGEDWTACWIDRCGWRDLPRPALIAPKELVAERITREVGHRLRARGVGVELELDAA